MISKRKQIYFKSKSVKCGAIQAGDRGSLSNAVVQLEEYDWTDIESKWTEEDRVLALKVKDGAISYKECLALGKMLVSLGEGHLSMSEEEIG